MLELIPDRPALCRESACTVDLLVRISAAAQANEEPRPPLNLSLVIDRSGSMGGEKIALTRQAAATVVRSLTQRDLLSIVLFDDQIEVLLPCSAVYDPEGVVKLLDRAEARGNTALFDGWRSGAEQASRGRDERRLNRVILLTDGQANQGETNTDRICTHVHRLAQEGVQSTTLGFGNDYNEQLLRSMAASGNGNHFYVQAPRQLAPIFQQELAGLTATVGTSVRLRLVRTREDVHIEALGELQLTPDGDYALADLTYEAPLEQLFRVTVPAGESEDAGLLVQVRWHSPQTGSLECCEQALRLPRVAARERLNLPLHEAVEEKLAVAAAARSRREAMAALDNGEKARAAAILEAALETRKLPPLEKAQLQQLHWTVMQGDRSASNKMFTSQSYAYSRGSVSLGAMESVMAQQFLATGQIDLEHSSFFDDDPAAGPATRAVGILAGLFAGSGPAGQATEQTLACFPLFGGRPKFIQVFMPLQKTLAETPVSHPLPSQLAFAQHYAQTQQLQASDLPDWGAVARIPLNLTAFWKMTPPRLWHNLLVNSHFTHNHGLSARCCLAYAHLLRRLSGHLHVPPAEAFARWFIEAVRSLETSTRYDCPNPRYDGWRGPFSDFLEMTLAEARKLTSPWSLWRGGDHLFDVIPAFLTVLERHAGEPATALAVSPSPGVRTLVGATLGALFGRRPEWNLSGSEEAVLQALEERLR